MVLPVAPVINPNTNPEDIKAPLLLMPLEDVQAELKSLAASLPDTPQADPFNDEVSETVIIDLHNRISAQANLAGSDNGKDIHQGLSRNSAGFLRLRIARTLEAIAFAPSHCNDQFPPAYFALLPQNPADRIAHLLGKQRLPLAWVQSIYTGSI